MVGSVTGDGAFWITAGIVTVFFSGELLTSFWAAMKADSRLASLMATSILSTNGCSWLRSAL